MNTMILIITNDHRESNAWETFQELKMSTTLESKSELLLTLHSNPLAVLSGFRQDEEPFCQVSAGRLAWEDQKVVATPVTTHSNINILHEAGLIACHNNKTNCHSSNSNTTTVLIDFLRLVITLKTNENRFSPASRTSQNCY